MNVQRPTPNAQRRSRTNRASAFALFAAAMACLPGCPRSSSTPSVVVYTSVDEVYARPVLERFTKETGIRVDAKFDTEAGKTTGLYNLLLAERERPVADVFWNNEICRTIQLAEAGLADDLGDLAPADLPRRWVDPGGRWAAFSLRARAIVYNTTLLKPDEAPRTLAELALPAWRGKVAMANPLFGTTAGHCAALYETLGDTRADAFLTALKQNGVRLVEGNSVVRDLVARGDVSVGLTDSDDVFVGIDRHDPIALILPDQEGAGTFVMPNTVMVVKGGPHGEAARRLVQFLLSPEVERMQAFGESRQWPTRGAVSRPAELAAFAGLRALDVDYSRVAARMPDTARRVERIFLLR
jgi:iron(III) transport system substrate-binding protein